MNRTSLVVIATPIKELHDQEQSLLLRCVRDLSSTDIKELLRSGPLRFVIACVGTPLVWIPETEVFQYWKTKVSPHLVEPGNPSTRIFLDNYPHGYAYTASEWEGAPYRVVLLTTHH